MAGLIDTNLLLYAANRDAEEHGAARQFVIAAARSADQWYLTEGSLYEFLRVATHPKVFSQPLAWREALRFLQPLLSSPRFRILTAGEEHFALLEPLLAALTRPAGNVFFDVRTAVLMREHGVRKIYTTDTDFLAFPDVEVVNPLRPPER